MKFLAAVGLGLIPFVVAQSESLGPAPTESFGCEPHGDHYHCEGNVSETMTQVSTTVTIPTTTATEDHDHDHDHEHDHDDEETGSIPPSPTASIGCEPHGDHWHCEGPATPTGSASETLPPSPTASTGCEPHGDHWHCDAAATPTDGSSSTPTDGVAAQMIPLAGVIAAVAFAI